MALQGASLTFEPVDAQYSPALGKIVMVSANPNLLHIYDPGFNTDTTVPLSYVPLAVSVSPAGDYAAVMHNGWVSYVNLLQPGTVQTFQTGVPSGSIVLSAANLYVFPFSQSEPEFLTFAWGPPFTNANGFQEGSGSARLDPAQDAIFGVRDDISPSNLFKANLASYGFSGVPTYGPYNGDYPVCGNVWFSGDGSTVYTGCGTVFHASDMTYAGSLDGLSAVQSLDESSTEVAAIPAAADTEVRIYESTYLNQTGQFALPNSAHGKWVFFNQAGTVIYAIAEAGSSYELDTIDLANPVTCVSGFTSNTSVSVAASGALENATINSNTGCAFQATSNASWISLVSGSYGSGDTTLSYVVRPNTGSQSRTDTITLDSGATLTISQAGSSGISTELVNLSVNPVAADYSKSLDKLVYVSASHNELHLYDPNSQSDTFIPLALTPTSVSVDPSGLFAAVG
ncbi:MAG: BACON domain-containing protein, partial [Bryobacteraceae bacterium]